MGMLRRGAVSAFSRPSVQPVIQILDVLCADCKCANDAPAQGIEMDIAVSGDTLR